ncbi:hypothetical protein HGM15179_016355 [Zosterops borbonicus]|uniref:Uncharacterized protein n=1 Tax=Zosterops borbonicus TaxID=364589 RepID=A0A8K1LEA5_9PASS|nr:hypothetical protein HGM15179_016355 [Zosterops borbonicus]
MGGLAWGGDSSVGKGKRQELSHENQTDGALNIDGIVITGQGEIDELPKNLAHGFDKLTVDAINQAVIAEQYAENETNTED